jgi:putative hydrolase of the HAD superfamily
VRPALQAVTFDFWNTLVHETPGQLRGLRIDAWEQILERCGMPVARETIEVAIDESWRTFDAAWQANHQYRAADAAALVLAKLPVAPERDVRDELVDVFVSVATTAELPVTGNVDVALAALKDAGVQIGIICDVGMTPSTILREHLDKHGLLQWFDHWSFSDEVGVYKPDRRIFDHALAGLGDADPAATAHIGDLRRTDVAGAQALGITSVRYTGVWDDPPADGLPEADLVVADHADLAAALLAHHAA